MIFTSCSIFWASHARPKLLSLRQSLPDDSPHWRLFVAAPLPEAAADHAWEALFDLRAKHPRVRWLPPDKLHLTLVFLGPTEASRVKSIAAGVASAAQRHAPFQVATGDAGGRIGGRRGGVAWLRLTEGGHEVAQVALNVDEAIGSGNYDAGKLPRPHLTVARGVADDVLADLRGAASRIRLGWTVDRLVLFRSRTDLAGSTYQALSSAVLSGAAGGKC